MKSKAAAATGLLFLSTLLSGAGAAEAQSEIQRGQTVSGTLTSSDSHLGDGTPYDVWIYRGTPGEEVIVTMTSDDFDTFLSVGVTRDGSYESMEFNDDIVWGSDTDSRVTVRVGSSPLTIRANSTVGEMGSYRLSVAPGSSSGGSEPRRAERRVIRSGERLHGSLSSSDAQLSNDDSYYDLWNFEGEAGDRIRITMTSDDFDAFLHFGVMEAGEFVQIDTNDDGPDMGTDSRLEVTLTASGTYAIMANSLSSGDTGSYMISVDPVR